MAAPPNPEKVENGAGMTAREATLALARRSGSLSAQV